MRQIITLGSALLILAGCANREGVAPSQNPSLQAISPSTTATTEGGYMQRGLDAWLKEEWTPLTQPSSSAIVPVPSSPSAVSGTSPATSAAAPVTPVPEDTTPFTLQKYVDKWKVYQENKTKLNEGKPKEASHVQQMEALPVIGK